MKLSFLSDTIGKDFVLFMLRLIETPSDEADEDDIVLLVVNLILVYNLQFNNFEDISTNITIQALEEIENPKIFSETLLLLFNRGSTLSVFFDTKICTKKY